MAALRPHDLAALLRRPDIRRGGAVAVPEATVATGFAALDALLPGGGWPRGALTELLPDTPGCGEIALLAPALARLSAAGGWLALVAPPWPAYAPAWAQLGVHLDRLVVVEAEGAAATETLWACEQILAAGAFAACLAWLPKADMRALRRLQLAQQERHGCAFLLRPAACAAQPSPAPLRLQLASDEAQLAVRVLKRRGPPVDAPVMLPVRRPVVSPHVPEPTSCPVAGTALPAVAAGRVPVA